MTIDPSRVKSEGWIKKKGSHLYSVGFKSRYFYLEDHLLKYGKKPDQPRLIVDLSDGIIEVKANPRYRTQFTIIEAKGKHIKLKAESEFVRDQWVSTLKRIVEIYVPSSTP